MGTEEARVQPAVAAVLDAELAGRLRQADAGAQAELCDRFGPALHQYAASRLFGDQELAQEVMAETLVDAVRNIRRYNPRKSNLSAWLHGIARHRIQRQLRRQRRRQSVSSSSGIPLEALEGMPSAEDVAATATAHLDMRERVAYLSAILSDVEMEVLVLRCVGELSAREASRVMGRSTRAVETLFLRAKQKAREGLSRYGR